VGAQIDAAWRTEDKLGGMIRVGVVAAAHFLQMQEELLGERCYIDFFHLQISHKNKNKRKMT